MAENFLKHKGGPTKVATHGRPEDPKGTYDHSAPQPHPGHTQVKKHPATGTKKPHSPPVKGTRMPNPTPRIPMTHGPTSSLHGEGGKSPGHVTVQGSRHAKGGGASMRPYLGAGDAVHPHDNKQTHTMAGAIAPRLKHGTTKSVRGMIGKPRKKKSSRLY